jgi:hypothetical protein
LAKAAATSGISSRRRATRTFSRAAPIPSPHFHANQCARLNSPAGPTFPPIKLGELHQQLILLSRLSGGQLADVSL